MRKYQKKPVVIEAVQNLPENESELFEFFRVTDAQFRVDGPYTFAIITLEGTMIASPGDWLIRGVKGEVYPCKPDIFAETYELVDNHASS